MTGAAPSLVLLIALVAGLATPGLVAAEEEEDEEEEYEEIGNLDCRVKRWRNLILYSEATFHCVFDALEESYEARATKAGFNLKWKFGETVRLRVFSVQKKPEARLSAGALRGKYREMDFGLGVGVAADFSLALKRGDDVSVVLEPEPEVSTGLGVTWTLGSLELKPSHGVAAGR